jgi:hypothetical protein
MTSPRLTYYAERAAAQGPLNTPAPLHNPRQLDAAQGLANGVGYGVCIWIGIIMLFALMVQW